MRDWASLSPENLSSPWAGGGWQFSVLRSDLSVPRLLPTPACGASTPHLRTNFLQFPGAQELHCQATPHPQRGPFSLRLALHPGTGPLCSPHLPGPALGGHCALLAQRLPSPLISSRDPARPSEGHESAAHLLPEAFGRTHGDEPPGALAAGRHAEASREGTRCLVPAAPSHCLLPRGSGRLPPPDLRAPRTGLPPPSSHRPSGSGSPSDPVGPSESDPRPFQGGDPSSKSGSSRRGRRAWPTSKK